MVTVPRSLNRFRNALVADTVLVQQYNELKQQHDGKPMDLYRRAKRRFIETVIGQVNKEG